MSDYDNCGGTAFPFPTMEQGSTCTNGPWAASPGMTLRDYFAGQALAGLSVATESDMPLAHTWNWPNLARAAYMAADAMLKARAGKDGS